MTRTHERNKSGDHQRANLRRLLGHVWKSSPFYRDYYQSHGIRKEDLREITTSDLPILSKPTLLENFDRAVTDPRLNRAAVERWLQDNPEPHKRFARDFVVLHTSGSSGNIAIFVYDEKAWRIADFAMASRLPLAKTYPSEPIRAAFYMAAHGHFAMVSVAASMQKPFYDTLILSLLDSRERVVEQLNTFKPQRLYGYASCIAELANLALEGQLHIQPTWILVAGDKLTPSMEEKIRHAWAATLYVTYGASESKYIAMKQAGQQDMSVLDELNIVEVLDTRRRPARSGSEGRVVLTNLYNYTLPIIRYEFDDYVVVGKEDNGITLGIRDIKGRVNDALPVVLTGGKHETIHPIILSEFHVPQLERVQFISRSPHHVCIQYVAPADIDAAVATQFQRILNAKGATQTTFDVHHVQTIPNDPATGKLRLVKRGGVDENNSSAAEIYTVRALNRPERRSIHEVFEEQVRGRPDSVAILCDNDTLTYAQLNAGANQLAHHLQSLGVQPGSLVGVCVARSVNIPIAILGILKAGGAWVPVDPAYPAERQSLIFKDARISILVTEESIAPELPPGSIETTVLLDRDWNSISRCSTSDPPTVTHPGSLAYVMYTSGSTGRPKGVMISRGNLSYYAEAMRNRLGISDHDVYLLTASTAFSSSVRQLMVPLACGAKVVVANTEDIRQPLSLFAAIREHSITVMDVVPSYWRTCIDALSDLDHHTREDLLTNRLRLILTASEILPPDLPERWHSMEHAAQLINMFGQTETTGIVATYSVPHSSNPQSKSVPIGNPIPGARIYVLDDHLNEVPAGTVGELYVAGPGVGVGYLNQPEATAERFLLDPFTNDPVERIYKTGDLGRRMVDGVLEFVGRIDHQVKVRGIRVELQEIEAALHTHAGIKENVVTARQDEPNNQRIVAYVVPAEGRTLSVEALRAFLAARIPEFMIPSTFVMMDSLPRLPNGKLDRLDLPAPTPTRPQLEHSVVAPRSATELKLSMIWQAVLVLGGIGVMDNFFDLGGNSLAALCILARVEKVFGKKLPPTAIFQAPTIEKMAQLLSQDGVTSRNSLTPLQTEGDKPPFFWVHGESSNAFLPRYLGPDQPIYGFLHQGQDGEPARFTTVEDMAGGYLEELRSVQPAGPYFLGGFCFGGLVAFEIAHQLRSQGEEVRLLVLFEPTPFRNCAFTPLLPLPRPPSDPSPVGLRAEFSRHLGMLRRLRPPERLAYVWVRVRNVIREKVKTSRPATFLKHARCFIHHCLGLSLPFSLRSFYILRVYRRATRRYNLRPYPGSVELFLHSATPAEGSVLYWSGIASGGVEIHDIPPGHEEILKEPYVRIWAQSLKASIDKAQARTAGVPLKGR